MSAGSFVDGALKGYTFVDDQQRKDVKDKQLATAIKDNKEFRDQSRQDALDHRGKMLEQSTARTGIARAQERRQAETHATNKKDRMISELIQDDARAGYEFFKHGTPYPDDLYAEMSKNDLLDRSLFTSIVDEKGFQASLKSEGILNSLKTGDVNAVNTPENLDILNDIYAPQIEKGIGEFNGPMGGSVVSKRISEISASPKTGAIVAEVTVNLDNGKSYTAPITMNRSTSDDDGVRLVDAKTAMDDLFGRYQRSKVSEPYRDRIRGEYTRLKNGANGAGTQSATGKTISDLMVHGKSRAEAIKMAVGAQTNPKKELASLTRTISESEWGMGRSPEENVREAVRILNLPDVESPTPEGEAPPVEGTQTAPPDAIEMLMKDPSLAPQFKAKYGYVPLTR